MDFQNRASVQELADTILAASTPPQINAACSAIDAFLRRRATGDQNRTFFAIAFPAFICRLFGFDDVPLPSSDRNASTAWIDQASADPSLSGHLFSLLAPEGIIVSSISAVDRHVLVRYVFPAERLPSWIRFALQSSRPLTVLSHLCPLLNGRVTEDSTQGSPYQIQLNTFEYYMFWFAYYPICRGNYESSASSAVSKSLKVRFENWTSSLPVLSSATRRPGQKRTCNLYLQLLYAYLRTFVPKCGLASYQPYQSSLLHYSYRYDNAAFLQAEFLVHTFMNFWMIDNDFSPLPVNLCRSLGFSFPYNAVLGKTPPTAALGDVLKLLVKYLNCNSNVSGGVNERLGESLALRSSWDGASSKKLMLYCENTVGSWNAVIQRPLYRFILRSFLFCPVEASLKNVSQVFNLWMSYLEAWSSSPEDFTEFDPPDVRKSENGGKQNGKKGKLVKEEKEKNLHFSLGWESYVLSNYLFYNSLVVHFLWFAHKFLHTNVESVVQMVKKVLYTLTASKQLLDFLRKVDAAYHSKPANSSAYSSNDVYKYVPSIREQLLDWEDGLHEGAVGSLPHENVNHDLKLFVDSEDGARNLLQLFVMRAEHEIQFSSEDVSSSILALDTIISQVNVLFGDSWRESKSAATSQADDRHGGHCELFTPKYPAINKHIWTDIKYKGDWMRRPISDAEVAWLARILTRISDRLNEFLGLSHVDESDSTGPTIVELSGNEVYSLEGTKETFNMLLVLVGSWFSLFLNTISRFMRAHRIKINLRVLASKKFVVLLVVYAIFCILKVLSRAFAVLTAV